VGTTTVNSSHALKVSKMVLAQVSATAASVTVTDLGGNNIVPPMNQAAAVGASTFDFVVPAIIPGGTNLSLTNAIVIVTGAGATLYVQHR
jgi:hypothetical protein